MKANRRAELGTILFISALIGVIACSSQSLWIDEAWIAWLASAPSIAGWWQRLQEISGSTLQMPFYASYLWVWEKAAGESEWALRAGNIPWLLVAQYALYRAGRRTAVNPLPLVAVTLVYPFLWYYLDEARPYMMQFAASSLTICGLAGILSPEGSRRSDRWCMVAGMLLLAGSSMLGAAWAGSALLAWLLIQIRRRAAPDLWPSVAAAIGLTGLATYYVWTLRSGARGTTAGTMRPENLLFALFELFGFTGLGPSRLEIRANGLASFPVYLWLVLPLGAVTLIVLFAATQLLRSQVNRERLLTGATYALVAAFVVTLLGIATKFRLLGRHFTPLAPVVCIVLAIGLTQIWRTRWRMVAAPFALLWICSCALLRFSPHHQKDDYRSAAAEARRALAQEKVVWWSADRAAGRYYGLPIDKADAQFRVVINAIPADLEKLPPADVVFASKPDLYDSFAALDAFLRARRYQRVGSFAAFSVWRR